MKIYTLLLGALFVSPTQAQTMHDWENHHVLQINREPARAAFIPFSTQKGDCSMSLDGIWKFRWTPVPDERIIDFYQANFNDKSWKDFPVPANWEVNGYGTPIYVSAGYPFKIDPPRVMGEPKADYTTYKERNPVGQYRRTFVLPVGWEADGQTFLRFEGVMSAFYVWINGERVGYSQGSMEPSEFNITSYLKTGENQIALEVYRYSDGSYLEDQDFWRFGGIHRSIHLIHTPDIRIRDYAIRTLPASAGEYKDFILQIDPQFNIYGGMTGKGYTIQGMLKDATGKVIVTLQGEVEDILDLEHKASRMNEWYPQRGPRKMGRLSTVIKSPERWTAETPYLYKLHLALLNPEGKVIEIIGHIDDPGTDIQIGTYSFLPVSEQFFEDARYSYIDRFSGEASFYNEKTGTYDLVDIRKQDFTREELSDYIAADGKITVRYSGGNDAKNGTSQALPLLMVTGREN